jgi:hypothetical protein
MGIIIFLPSAWWIPVAIIVAYPMALKDECEDFVFMLGGDNLQNTGEIIDIDNDGAMEILTYIPHYELFDFRVFEYKDGVFSGDFITRGGFNP